MSLNNSLQPIVYNLVTCKSERSMIAHNIVESSESYTAIDKYIFVSKCKPIIYA